MPTIIEEINRIKSNIQSAYTVINERGSIFEGVENSANLAQAITDIPEGIFPEGLLTLEQNGQEVDCIDYASVVVRIPIYDGSFTINKSGGEIM